jgi:hypothetical protein
MTPRLIPNPRTSLIGYHNRINVLSGSEIFSSPAHGSELLLGRVVRVHIRTLPAPNELLRLDRLQFVKGSEDIIGREVLALDEGFVLLFGCSVE